MFHKRFVFCLPYCPSKFRLVELNIPYFLNEKHPYIGEYGRSTVSLFRKDAKEPQPFGTQTLPARSGVFPFFQLKGEKKSEPISDLEKLVRMILVWC